MKINLLVDYRGVLTEEEYFPSGRYEVPKQMPTEQARALINAGRAKEIKPRPRRASRKKAVKK